MSIACRGLALPPRGLTLGCNTGPAPCQRAAAVLACKPIISSLTISSGAQKGNHSRILRRRIAKDAPKLPDGSRRLNKAIASAGICSRRAADELVLSGQVSINGSVVHEPGTQVDLSKDKVSVKGKLLTAEAAAFRFYFAVNKPKGFLCSSTGEGGKGRLVTQLLDPWLSAWREKAPKSVIPPRLFTVGRLDAQSVGLIFVTNDGDWAQRVMHPSSGLTKEYSVTLATRPRLADLRKLAAGAAMEDGTWVTPVSVALDDTVADKPNRLRIVVTEGRNREVRTLMAAAGMELRTLRRTRVGAYRLAPGLPFGAVRELSPRDVRRVLDLGAQDRV